MEKLRTFTLILGLILLSLPLLASESEAPAKDPAAVLEFSNTDKAKNFAAVYGFQWGFYLLSQEQTIRTHGSFNNWLENPFHPEFDKDTFDYNIFKHAFSGSYYYLYYRSRGYTEQSAFIWTVASSMAFEFTIETVTERPSIQDMYQTPLFGAIVGVGFETLSLKLHSLDTWYGHALGYLLNPFTLLPHDTFTVAPVVSPNQVGALMSWSY